MALDVARVLAKHAEDMLKTEVPANVAEGLAENPITDVHVFGRRGPAQVKFTPLELRELGKVPDVDVIVRKRTSTSMRARRRRCARRTSSVRSSRR